MLSQTRFCLVAVSLLVALPSDVLHADEKNPPLPRALGAMADMEFEVKKRELACKMAELSVEEAKISLERVEIQLEKARSVGAGDDTAQLTLNRKQATFHVEMRKLAAEVTRVELEQAKARLHHLQKAVEPISQLDGPVQVEILEGLDVTVLRGSKEDVEKVSAMVSDLRDPSRKGQPAGDTAAIEPLLKQRRDTLKQLVDVVKQEHRQGEAGQRSVVRAYDALLEAELAFTTDRPERIALKEKRVANMKELEQITKALHEAAQVGLAEVLDARAARLEAEIDLLRERASGK